MNFKASENAKADTEKLFPSKDDLSSKIGNDSNGTEEISPEILQQLSSDNSTLPLDLDTISLIAEFLARKYDHNFDQAFRVIGNPKKFAFAVQSLLSPSSGGVATTSNEAGNIFLLLRIDDRHWTTLSVIKNRTLLLYKDSHGEHILNEDYLSALQSVGFSSKRLLCHNGIEISKEKTDDGIMCLRNLDIILEGLRSNPEEFIQSFRKTKFCLHSQVDSVRGEYRKELQLSWSKDLINDLMKLKNDSEFGEFVKELNIFMETCLKYRELSVCTQKYVQMLNEELEKIDADEGYWESDEKLKTLEDAKKAMLENEQIQQTLEQQKQTINVNANNENLAANKVGIEQKFPIQMKLFTNIFKYLFKCNANKKLESALRIISKNFNVDYDKVKLFFEFEKEQNAKLVQSENFFCENNTNCDSINNGLNVLTLIDSLSLNDQSTKNGTPSSDYDVKSIDQLLCEFVFENSPKTPIQNYPEISENIWNSEKLLSTFYEDNPKAQKLRDDYSKVKDLYDRSWKTKTAADIHSYAISLKQQNKSDLSNVPLIIAMMDRANELATSGHRLRDPQILSVLTFLQSGTDKGTLCQIHTGEGKTTIVALLAALKVLGGEKFIDVITSNNVLAEEAVNDKRNFYSLLGITVSSNVEQPKMPHSISTGAKSCYSSDIVYGSIGNFQFDYLRDLTSKNACIRRGRQFGFLILDEVDSMIIDSGGHIAKLSVPLPGMDSLKYVYIRIWQALCSAETAYIEKMVNKIKQEGEQEINFSIYGPDLILQTHDYIKAKIRESNPLDIELIPVHLQNFASRSLEKWIENAIYAKFSCNENEQYVLSPDASGGMVVVPLDYANTGVSMKNTIWSHALHQFVQIKHNLQLTAESLTSSSISNYGYINLYGNKIFGLTGTLGSEPEQHLMARMYSVEFARIPTFKKKKFRELVGRVVRDVDWGLAVAVEAERQALKDNRAVLIISKTIADCLVIEKSLIKLQNMVEPVQSADSGNEMTEKIKIKKFFDESGAQILKTDVQCGDVIIATNIAGRGADFKTSSELEVNGGLHVCTTFYPDNERVKEQAFFRTSRQGNNGTARIIMRESEVKALGIHVSSDGLNRVNFREIKSKVELIERNRIDFLKEFKVPQLYFEDYLFTHFAKFCKTVEERNSNSGFMTYERDKSKKLSSFVMEDLKEFWAFWLETQNFGDNFKVPQQNFEKQNSNQIVETHLRNEAEKVFADFKSKAAEILSGIVSHNPYYSIKEAEDFLVKDKIDEAQNSLIRAIQLCSRNGRSCDVLYAAHMKLFEIAVKKGGVLMNRFKDAVAKVFVLGYFVSFKDVEYKEIAVKHLMDAKQALEREIEYLEKNIFESPEFSQIIGTSDLPNVFLKHLKSRLVSLNVFKENAVQLLGQLKESEESHPFGLYIGSRVPNYLKKLSGENENELKKVIQESTLNELGVVGLDTIYALQKVHDAPPEIIAAAQVQIAAGIATHATGICFPPLLPITVPIVELLVNFQGKSEFNGKTYLQGKLVSYGISLLTAGASAILSSSKILAKASKTCESLATLLRKCPSMKTLCNILANQLDKLSVWLSRMAEIAKAASKAQAVQKLTNITWNATEGAAKGVVGSLVIEKVTTHVLDASLQNLKPCIKEMVKGSVTNNIDKSLLVHMDPPGLSTICEGIMAGSMNDMLIKVAQDIGLGLLRHSNTWKAKLTSLAIDTCLTASKLIYFTEDFCKKVSEQIGKVKCKIDGEKTNATVIEDVEDQLVQIITDQIYSVVIQLAGKYTNMFVVSPLISKLFDSICSKSRKDEENKEEKQEESEEDAGENANKEEHTEESLKMEKEQMQKELGLPEDASHEEIGLAYYRRCSDKDSILEKAHAGYESAKNGEPLGSTSDINILSKTIRQPITVIDVQGNKTETFGGDEFRGTPPVVVEFHKGVGNTAGHYTLNDGKEPPVQTSSSREARNNCLLNAIAYQSTKSINSSELRVELSNQYKNDVDVLLSARENDKLHGQYANYNEKYIGGEPTMPKTFKETLTMSTKSDGTVDDMQARIAAQKKKDPEPGHAMLKHVLTKTDPCTGKVRTAFNNVAQADAVLHAVASHPDVVKQVEHMLNVEKVDRVLVKFPLGETEFSGLEVSKITPNEHTKVTTVKAQYVLAIFGHQKGQKDNPNSLPHLQTFYPCESHEKEPTEIVFEPRTIWAKKK